MINYNKPLIWEWFIPKQMVTGGWCKWHCFTHTITYYNHSVDLLSRFFPQLPIRTLRILAKETKGKGLRVAREYQERIGTTIRINGNIMGI